MSEDELREQLTKVITDAYMLGKSDQLMKLNDFAELSTGIVQKAHNLYERIALESRIETIDNYLKQCRMLRTEPSSRSLELFSDDLKAQLTNLDNSNKESV